MKLFKAHADGNDYLTTWPEDSDFHESNFGPLARRLCDRHFGIGADGVVFLQPAGAQPTTDWDCRIFNPDGGEAEVSGNGLRCAAACLGWADPTGIEEWRLNTNSGLKGLRQLRRIGNRFLFQTDMGSPLFDSLRLPISLPNSPAVPRDYPLEVEGNTFYLNVLSVGNPHCVLFYSSELPARWEYWSARIAEQALFPAQTNVEWARQTAPDRIEVFFWERGVGPTLSSGSGSCAAAVMSILNGRSAEKVTVINRVGEMIVEWHPPNGAILLTGPAEVIMQGTYLLPRLPGSEKDYY